MASDLEIVGRIFGDKAMVAALGAAEKQVRMRIYGAMRNLARQYAEQVSSSGLTEQGIKSRTGKLSKSMVVRGSLSSSRARVLIYPGAVNAAGYRYPWAIGQGSPKGEISVRAHLRKVPAGSGTRRRSKRGRIYSAKAEKALVAGGAVAVGGYHRRVNLKPRPFMSGSALTRLQGEYQARMEQAIREAVSDAMAVTGAADEGAGGA